jgi:uncharacterized protein (TIGR03083 family)
MNAVDIFERGHQVVAKAVDGLPDADWETSGVCGVWSVREVVAHLATYEHMLAEALEMLAGADEATPHLDEYRSRQPGYNEDKVAERRGKSPADVWAEYRAAYDRAVTALRQIPAEKLRAVGTIPWFDPQGSIDDLVVRYGFGHKREHATQIMVYRDRIGR